MSYDYRVVAVSKYKDARNETQTSYAKVGVAFANTNRTTGKITINVKIGPEILLSNRCELVLFEADPKSQTNSAPPAIDDEVPF